MFLSGLETLLQQNGNTGHFVGSALTVADISLWRMCGWLTSGVIDGIPAGFVPSTFPGIAKPVPLSCHQSCPFRGTILNFGFVDSSKQGK